MRASMSVWSSVRRPRRSTRQSPSSGRSFQISSSVLSWRKPPRPWREEMLKDWKAAGAEDSTIEAWRDKDPRLVADVHQQMKVKGLAGIRSYDEILKASAHRIGSEFNIALTKEGGGKEGDKGNGAAKPAPKQEKPRITVGPEEKEARINAKRQQQQPKSAGGREPLHQQARLKTTAEIIAEMKRSRAGAPQR